jgi:hypothetical protein
MVYISPKFQDTDFVWPPSLNQKIDIFEDRVQGWQLSIAESCRTVSEHSGYGVLHIITSYFEMIAKYLEGFAARGQSEEYFRKGALAVLPETAATSDTVLKHLYEGLRCGLYHGGMTTPRILISWGADHPMLPSADGELLLLNPELLLNRMTAHFSGYVSDLRNTANHDLRTRFEKRFDFCG